jgi:hypothetical protein
MPLYTLVVQHSGGTKESIPMKARDYQESILEMAYYVLNHQQEKDAVVYVHNAEQDQMLLADWPSTW